jgi:hypothetical protein
MDFIIFIILFLIVTFYCDDLLPNNYKLQNKFTFNQNKNASSLSNSLLLHDYENGQYFDNSTIPTLPNGIFDTVIKNKTNPFIADLDNKEQLWYNIFTLEQQPYGRTSNVDFLLEDWIEQDYTISKGNKLIDIEVDSSSPNLLTSCLGWENDTVIFSNLGIALVNIARAQSNIGYSDSYLNSKLRDMLLVIVKKIDIKITDWVYKDNTFPWGANWYEFTVSFPYYMCATIFHMLTIYKKYPMEVNYLKDFFIRYENKLVETPVKGLGWTRTGSNTLLQGASWMICKYWDGTLDSYADNEDYKYMIVQSNIVKVTEGEGLRPDYGWIFHIFVRAYGYLSSTINYALIINVIEKNNYKNVSEELSAIMSHPIIKAQNPALFSRTPQVQRFLNSGEYGYSLQYSTNILTIKNENLMMQIYAQDYTLAIYESDKTNEREMQLWTMAREIWLPHAGIRQYNLGDAAGPTANVTYVPGVSSDNNQVEIWPSQETTTDATKPTIGLGGVIKLNESTNLFINIFQAVNNKALAADSTDHRWFERNTFLNKTVIHEYSIITNQGRLCLIIYVNDDESQMDNIIHTMDSGVIAKTLDEKTYEFTNGLCCRYFVGDLVTADVQFIIQPQNGADKYNEVQTALQLKPVPLNTEIHGKHITYVFYQVCLEAGLDNIEHQLIPIGAAENTTITDGYVKNGLIDWGWNQQAEHLSFNLLITPEKNKNEYHNFISTKIPDQLGMWLNLEDEEQTGYMISLRKNNSSRQVFKIGGVLENLPLGIVIIPIRRENQMFKYYINNTFHDNEHEYLGADTVNDTYEVISTSMFDYDARVSLRWFQTLKEISWDKSTYEVNNNLGYGNTHWPKDDAIDDEFAYLRGGLPLQFLGVNDQPVPSETRLKDRAAATIEYLATLGLDKDIPEDQWDNFNNDDSNQSEELLNKIVENSISFQTETPLGPKLLPVSENEVYGNKTTVPLFYQGKKLRLKNIPNTTLVKTFTLRKDKKRDNSNKSVINPKRIRI